MFDSQQWVKFYQNSIRHHSGSQWVTLGNDNHRGVAHLGWYLSKHFLGKVVSISFNNSKSKSHVLIKFHLGRHCARLLHNVKLICIREIIGKLFLLCKSSLVLMLSHGKIQIFICQFVSHVGGPVSGQLSW